MDDALHIGASTVRFLLRFAELELIERERRMVESRGTINMRIERQSG